MRSEPDCPRFDMDVHEVEDNLRLKVTGNMECCDFLAHVCDFDVSDTEIFLQLQYHGY